MVTCLHSDFVSFVKYRFFFWCCCCCTIFFINVFVFCHTLTSNWSALNWWHFPFIHIMQQYHSFCWIVFGSIWIGVSKATIKTLWPFCLFHTYFPFDISKRKHTLFLSHDAADFFRMEKSTFQTGIVTISLESAFYMRQAAKEDERKKHTPEPLLFLPKLSSICLFL